MGSNNLINLCSLNVNGMHSKEKRNRVIEWVKTHVCSIAFLQETHIDENIEKEIRNNSKFEIVSNHGTSASRGVSILLNKSLNFAILDKWEDKDGRLLLINIQIDDTIFTLVCIYAPNCKTARNAFFKKVSSILKEYGTGIPILGGDFNETMNQIDRKSASRKNTKPQQVSSLKTLIKSNKLTDIWRDLNENVQQFTWRRKDKSQASRIDMIFIGMDFRMLVESCKIKPAFIHSTDHLSVFLKLRSGVQEKGRGFWKINNSILQELEYQTLINHLIDKHIENSKNNQIDSRLVWDVLKIEIRDHTIMYCKNKSKLNRQERRSLEKELNVRLAKRNSMNVEDTNLNDHINLLELKLEKIYQEKAKGAQVRAREQWVELGEKNNSYFLGLEKKRQVKKSINKIKNENNDIATKQSEILEIIKTYYEKLYSSNKPNKHMLQKYIFETKLEKTLSEKDKSICDGEITVTECSDAVNEMKLNKSPGLDGLSVEFYRTFWDKLKYFLIKTYNKGYNENLLTYSQRSSVLALLFKKGDPLLLDNFRPISLLNVDLKILSHVLAQRLKKILSKLINEDQTGYIKNRFIGFNLRQIQDIIDYADIYKIEGSLVFIDFKKAFDSLEWDFMLLTLKRFGFNDSFVNWVKTMYTDIQTCVINNGWISEMFRNTRGNRQGVPCRPSCLCYQ